MAKLESSLVIRRMPWHANFTEKNHLGAALIAKPAVFEGKMNQLFSATMYSDNPMSRILTEMGAEKTITSSEWTWKMRGSSRRPMVYMGTAATGTPGVGGLEFDFITDTNWCKPGDIMSPGNPSYQIRIQSGPQPSGGKFIYRAVVNSTNAAAFIPLKYLKPGATWNKLNSQYEEGSEQSGSTTYALPIELKNRLSRFRKSESVTGDAANEVLAVKVPDSNGKLHNMWMKYAEAEFWMQWYRELEIGTWYGHTSNVEGSTSRPLMAGPGIQEQVETDGHIHYYNTLTTTLIQEFLMDIFYSRTAPGPGRNLKAFTGEYGMILFDRAISSLVSGSGFIHQVQVTQDVSSPLNTNAKAGGYQFVSYRGKNGVSLDLIHNPLYDDTTLNSEIDPISGYPLESMRFTFLDLAGTGASNNIQLVRKDKGYALGYVAGMQNPYGPVNNSLMSHAGDYYEVHVKDQRGVHIEDITKCGELIPVGKQLAY